MVAKLAVSGDIIQAAVILHPGAISDKEFNGKLMLLSYLLLKSYYNSYSQPYFFLSDIRVPIALLGAEIDDFFPKEKLKQAEELLSAKAEVKNSC